MSRYEVTIEIASTVDHIWSVMSQVDRWPEWDPVVQSVTPVTSGSMGKGSRYRVVQPGLASMVWEVTEFAPGKGFVWEARSPGVWSVAEHWITSPPTNGVVPVKLVIRQEGWLFSLIGWMFASRTQRYVNQEARGLQLRCERPAP